ncbi:MAG: hypothetical protein R2755_26735 [Acidimicrobiales bacterium]
MQDRESTPMATTGSSSDRKRTASRTAAPNRRAANGRTVSSNAGPDGAATAGSDDHGLETPTGAAGEVRYAFQLPRSTLRAVKQLALDRDVTASDLVRAWVEAGLAGAYDGERVPVPAWEGAISQFPVTIASETKAALQQRCAEEGLSGAQLVRRWVAHGLRQARIEQN